MPVYSICQTCGEDFIQLKEVNNWVWSRSKFVQDNPVFRGPYSDLGDFEMSFLFFGFADSFRTIEETLPNGTTIQVKVHSYSAILNDFEKMYNLRSRY